MFASVIDKNVFTTKDMQASAQCLLLRLNAVDIDDNGNADHYHILSTLNEINLLNGALRKANIVGDAIVIRRAALSHYIKKHGGHINEYTKIIHHNIIVYAKQL